MPNKILDLEGLTYYDSKIKTYITDADNAVTSNLEAQIEQEATARQEADTQLQNNIDAEETARQQADTQLQNNIDAEETARQQADAQLQTNIDNEATARQQAINTAISGVIGDAGTNYNTLGKLEDALQAEITRAGNAEDAIDEDLQSFKTSTNQNITQLEQDLASEGTRITNLENNTVKLTGQTNQVISGNVQVQGNLVVNGTTTTNDTETLLVQDNLIVTNSSKVTLNLLSGLAINMNSSSAFGVLYDPATQELKAGIGTLNSSNEFTFSSGEGYPVTLRDTSTSFTEGHIVTWDSADNKLVDGGILASNIAQQNGTYANMSVGSATRATEDSSGNNIINTYATITLANSKYSKPSSGIPATDLAQSVQDILDASISQSEVIEYLDSIPSTVNADSPSFIEVNGVLYQKKYEFEQADSSKLEGVWGANGSVISGIADFDSGISSAVIGTIGSTSIYGCRFSTDRLWFDDKPNYSSGVRGFYTVDTDDGLWANTDDIIFNATADTFDSSNNILTAMQHFYTKKDSENYYYEQVGGEYQFNPNGTYNGLTAGYADRATNDANGNNIVNTYATKAEIPDIPDASATYNGYVLGVQNGVYTLIPNESEEIAAVLYTAQTLTTEQAAQARQNIDAPSSNRAFRVNLSSGTGSYTALGTSSAFSSLSVTGTLAESNGGTGVTDFDTLFATNAEINNLF